MGADVTIVHACGVDPAGKLLHRMLTAAGVRSLQAATERTTTKTRGFVDHRQVFRFDEDNPASAPTARECMAQAAGLLASHDALAIADYGKGVTDYLGTALIQQAYDEHKPVYVDPHGHDWDKYAGALVIKANEHEVADCLQYDEDAVTRIRARHLVVTMGKHGSKLVTRESDHLYPAPNALHDCDPTGAGDSFFAQMVLAHVDGNPWPVVMRRANVAGMLAARQRGIAVISERDIKEYLDENDSV
jgi:rfaE bifunctional protein kinase chain/domain